MDHLLPDYDQQIAAFLSGNITSSELEALEHWKNLSDENKKVFGEAVKTWNNCPVRLETSEIEQDKMAVQGTIMTQIALQQNRDRLALRFLRIAAIFIGPLMLGIGWYLGTNQPLQKTISWNSVSAPRKHIAVCNLADGTEVWLNAGSTLSYPSGEGSEKREVKLNGEGYFKVTKDARKPFFVITQNTTVKVLGTSFNIKAYPEEEQITTTLEEGSIQLTTSKTGDIPYLLSPGEQATYAVNDGKMTIEKVDAARFSAWRSEKFLFKDADMQTIIAELERLYDIKIHIQNPKLAKLRFRGMFSYDQDLLDAFETLKRSVKLNYTIKDREVWLQ
ncbi:MAG: FecR domain-containing protein [Mariniphaga sp.]